MYGADPLPLVIASILPLPLILGSSQARWLASRAMERVHQGMRPKTRTSYERSFHLFIAFTIYMKMNCPWKFSTLLAFFEYLATKALSAATLQNYVSVLNHYFKLYTWPTASLASRQVLLLIKSVQINCKMDIKLKGVFTINMLAELLQVVGQCQDDVVYQALFALAFFGFSD